MSKYCQQCELTGNNTLQIAQKETITLDKTASESRNYPQQNMLDMKSFEECQNSARSGEMSAENHSQTSQKPSNESIRSVGIGGKDTNNKNSGKFSMENVEKNQYVAKNGEPPAENSDKNPQNETVSLIKTEPENKYNTQENKLSMNNAERCENMARNELINSSQIPQKETASAVETKSENKNNIVWKLSMNSAEKCQIIAINDEISVRNSTTSVNTEAKDIDDTELSKVTMKTAESLQTIGQNTKLHTESSLQSPQKKTIRSMELGTDGKYNTLQNNSSQKTPQKPQSSVQISPQELQNSHNEVVSTVKTDSRDENNAEQTKSGLEIQHIAIKSDTSDDSFPQKPKKETTSPLKTQPNDKNNTEQSKFNMNSQNIATQYATSAENSGENPKKETPPIKTESKDNLKNQTTPTNTPNSSTTPQKRKKHLKFRPLAPETLYMDKILSPNIDFSSLSQQDINLLYFLQYGLTECRKIVCVAGAGISVAAGIPDFRSSNGLFSGGVDVDKRSTKRGTRNSTKNSTSTEKSVSSNSTENSTNGSVNGSINGNTNGSTNDSTNNSTNNSTQINSKQSTKSSTNQPSKLSSKELFTSNVYSDSKLTPYFHNLLLNLNTLIDSTKPTAFHQFVNSLAQDGKLLRLYTQNIDCLDTSLPFLGTVTPLRKCLKAKPARFPLTVQLHGSLKTMGCSKCQWIAPFDASVFKSSSPIECPECKELNVVRSIVGKRSQQSGIVRPRFVLYNEFHPDGEIIGQITEADVKKNKPDCLLIVGTSLKIPGVRRLVKEMSKSVHQRKGCVIWVNLEKPNATDVKIFGIDLSVVGDCQKIPELLRHVESYNFKIVQKPQMRKEKKEGQSTIFPGANGKLYSHKRAGSLPPEAVKKARKY